MLQEINLTTERKNPSYMDWIKNKLSQNIVRTVEQDLAEEEEEEEGMSIAADSSVEREEQSERKKAKDNAFLKKYLKTYDPNLQ